MLLLVTISNYIFTFHPSIIGLKLYDYFLTLTNKTEIYVLLLVLEGLGLLLSMIFSFIYSNNELASLKVPLLNE